MTSLKKFIYLEKILRKGIVNVGEHLFIRNEINIKIILQFSGIEQEGDYVNVNICYGERSDPG